MRPLSPRRSRTLVLALVAAVVGLAVLATVLITRGWSDEALQERVQQLEETGTGAGAG
jgi:hypothetical protein